MEGFYKQDENGSWYYAPNFVCAKDYTLEKGKNTTEIDGWKWYEKEPFEYTIWKNNIL